MGDLVLSTTASPGDAGWADVDTLIAASPARISEWPGTPEYEGLVVDTNPADGETYTLQVGSSTEVYTFKDTPVAANDVQRGGSAAATQSNLATTILAVQSAVVYAVDYANPLVLVANNVADSIVQTDGTGGDITIRTTSNWGQTNTDAQQMSFFHIRKSVTAAHVTDGGIYVPMPVGYRLHSYSGILLDGSGGKGQDSLEVKAGFDGVFTSSFPLAGEPDIIGVTQGTTTYAATDVLVLWGFLSLE